MIVVVGPTAAGKSALGLALAHALGGEIVNVDSMQLYRAMDIGTAKLTLTEREGVPHHLLDIWDVRVRASVSAYQEQANAVIADLRDRGVTPVLVGGSGLYVRAALGELDFPGTDAALRGELEAELASVGPGSLHARLTRRDPAAAAVILPSNGRRIVRALEVIELTGAPYAAGLPAYEPRPDVVQLGVDVGTDELGARIERRVERMWAAGLVEEVRALAKAGLREGPTASRALGYAQVLAMLDGELSPTDAHAETVRATRRFARRQRSWFRRDPRVHWLTEPSLAAALAVPRAG